LSLPRRPFDLTCLTLAFLLCGLAAVFPPASFAAENGTPYRRLTWDDFQGPAPAGRDVAAQTVSGISVRWVTGTPVNHGGTWRVKLEVQCKAVMHQNASGVKPGKKTDALLRHEQHHFDITEYWARAMGQALNAIEGTGATPQKAAQAASARAEAKAAELNRKLERMQDLYDQETDHGRHARRQSKWAAKIAVLLKASGPKSGNGAGHTD
jgi:hypothetical protein